MSKLDWQRHRSKELAAHQRRCEYRKGAAGPDDIDLSYSTRRWIARRTKREITGAPKAEIREEIRRRIAAAVQAKRDAYDRGFARRS